MKAQTAYRIVDRTEAPSSRELADALTTEGQMLLPILELIQNGRAVVDEAIDVMGRGTIEALLNLSARKIVGDKHQGNPSANDGGISRYGRQDGAVPLGDRKLRVSRPRLRRRGDGDTPSREEPVPAYQAMRSHPDAGGRLLEILIRGVSTRKYREVLPEMAGTLGVERSSVSREFVEASAKGDCEEIEIPSERPVQLDSGGMFDTQTVYFGKVRRQHIVCASRGQAELIARIAELHVTGGVCVPRTNEHTMELLDALNHRHAAAAKRLRKLAESRSGDSAKQDEVFALLERWYVLGRPTPLRQPPAGTASTDVDG